MIDLEAIRARQDFRKADEANKFQTDEMIADIDALIAEMERLNIEHFAFKETIVRAMEERQTRIEARITSMEILLPPKCAKCGWMFQTREQLAHHLVQFADKPCVIPYS